MFPIPGQEEYLLCTCVCVCVCWQSLPFPHLAGKQLTQDNCFSWGLLLSAWATSARGRGDPGGHNDLELLGLEGEAEKKPEKAATAYSVNLFDQVAFLLTFG